MTHLYHSVPRDLHGNVLYPLNTIKEKYPTIYEQEVSKYAGRERLKEMRIPILNCLWNDVLFLSAVNPKEIKQALIDAGLSPDFTMKYYQIDSYLIKPKDAIIYLDKYTYDKDKMNEENFSLYEADNIKDFSIMPQETKDYYKEAIGKRERPFSYHRIPHILYKGTLDITNQSIISV